MRVTADIVIPVLDEERVLEASVRRLHAHLRTLPDIDARIVIADNGSRDGTRAIAHRLAAELPRVLVLRLERRGRGRALRRAWLASQADLVAYMDVDLSTDLAALRPLIAAVASGAADIAVASRLAPGARTTRGLRRELISRVYNRVLRLTLPTPVRDAPCGCKVLRAETARALLAQVEDEAWFFDTELLVRAACAGWRLAEIPVRWVENRDSRVRILRTAWDDLRGIHRLRREGLGRATVMRFVALRSVFTASSQPLRGMAPAAAGTVSDITFSKG